MVIWKLTNFVWVLFLALPLAAQATGSAKRFNAFKDVTTGVTYRYSEGWKPLSGDQLDLHLVFVPDMTEIRSGLQWTPGESLKSTNLTGAEFVFALQRGTSSQDCLHPVSQFASGSHVDSVTLNGIKYAHNWTETGGLCHQMKEDIYATYRNNACYLFDLSVDTICSGSVDGMRNATKKELADIDAQLMSVLKTARIEKHTTNTPN